MQITNHPKELLQKNWIDILRKNSDEAEKNGQLLPEQIKLLYEQNWLNALTAKDYGGSEWSMPQIVSFEEAIGWADGSAGWLFTLCTGAAWFSGFLNKEFAKKIFSLPDVCIAGSGAATGVAKKINNETYLVSGRWKYATGAPFADVFTANCYVEDEQKVKAFCFLKEEVSVHKTWNTIGLVASSSESFSVHNVVVNKERCFEILPEKAVVDSMLYQYPFHQLAESTIAANVSGMALHFLEECESYFKAKNYRDNLLLWEHYKIQNVFNKAINDLNIARNNLHAAVDISWEELLSMKKISGHNLAEVSNTSQILAKVCRQAINDIYPYTGLTGANKQSAINKVWRDFQTGSQHAVFSNI